MALLDILPRTSPARVTGFRRSPGHAFLYTRRGYCRIIVGFRVGVLDTITEDDFPF